MCISTKLLLFLILQKFPRKISLASLDKVVIIELSNWVGEGHGWGMDGRSRWKETSVFQCLKLDAYPDPQHLHIQASACFHLSFIIWNMINITWTEPIHSNKMKTVILNIQWQPFMPSEFWLDFLLTVTNTQCSHFFCLLVTENRDIIKDKNHLISYIDRTSLILKFSYLLRKEWACMFSRPNFIAVVCCLALQKNKYNLRNTKKKLWKPSGRIIKIEWI